MKTAPRPGAHATWFALLVAAFVALLAQAVPSYADAATEGEAAGAAFSKGDHVYVSPQAGQKVDSAAVKDAVGSEPIYIAVVAPNNPPADVIIQLQDSMQTSATYVVISGTEQAAQSTVICSTSAQPLLDKAAKDEAKTRATGDLTTFLTNYIDKLAEAPKPGDSGCGDASASSGSGLLASLPWVLGALLLGAGGGYLWLRSRQKSKAQRAAGRGAAVAKSLDALARDIDEVGDGGDQQVQAALEDARDRHIAAADILAEADTDADFDAAARATREGAFAAHYARERAGLPSARPREVEAPRREPLKAERALLVGEEHVTAYPNYRPGAPYYVAGNSDLPAGWYTAPLDRGQFLGSIADVE